MELFTCGIIGVHGFGDEFPSESMIGIVDATTIEDEPGVGISSMLGAVDNSG